MNDPETPHTHTVVVLDSDGLGKAAQGAVQARAIAQAAAETGTPVLTSAVNLTETLPGAPRDAAVNRLLKGVEVVAADETIGRAAGKLLGVVNRSDTVDAIVVATARSVGENGGRALIVTSDPRDIVTLADGDPRISVQKV